MIEGIIRKYGNALEVQRGENWEAFRGFLQPSRSESLNNMVRGASPLGDAPVGHYLFIGPVSMAVAVGDTLRLGNCCYLLRRVEDMMGPEGPVYRWGLCVRKGEEDPWVVSG